MPLIEQNGLRYRDHADGDVPRFREHACRLGLKGVISKQAELTLRTWRPRDLGEVQVLGPLKVPKIRSVRPRQPVQLNLEAVADGMGAYRSGRGSDSAVDREEFVVAGWADPEDSPSYLGALFGLLYRLLHAGRAGMGLTDKELKRRAGVAWTEDNPLRQVRVDIVLHRHRRPTRQGI